jgi:hypothetical protein
MEVITKCPDYQGALQYIPPKTEDNIVAWILLIAGAFFAPVLIGIALRKVNSETLM